MVQNLCIPTAAGKKCAAWWAIWWQKVAQERVICQDWWKPSAAHKFYRNKFFNVTFGHMALWIARSNTLPASLQGGGYSKTAKCFISCGERFIVAHLGMP